MKPITKRSDSIPIVDSEDEENEQPIVSYEDTTSAFCRDESLIVFQSVVNENFQNAPPRRSNNLERDVSPPTGNQ